MSSEVHLAAVMDVILVTIDARRINDWILFTMSSLKCSDFRVITGAI
jgi:hypothetical protein